MKIVRMVFQEADPEGRKKMILVLDMEDQAGLITSQIPELAAKMETALPGVFPDPSGPLVHSCGGNGTHTPEHSFRQEIELGTDIPHLLEHVLLHLLSRRTYCCAGFCGQRSSDIEQGITTHYYVVLDYPSELEAVVAVGIAFDLVNAWIQGRNVTLDHAAVFRGINQRIAPMLSNRVTLPDSQRPI